jgi:hypothetical protein
VLGFGTYVDQFQEQLQTFVLILQGKISGNWPSQGRELESQATPAILNNLKLFLPGRVIHFNFQKSMSSETTNYCRDSKNASKPAIASVLETLFEMKLQKLNGGFNKAFPELA